MHWHRSFFLILLFDSLGNNVCVGVVNYKGSFTLFRKGHTQTQQLRIFYHFQKQQTQKKKKTEKQEEMFGVTELRIYAVEIETTH